MRSPPPFADPMAGAAPDPSAWVPTITGYGLAGALFRHRRSWDALA